MVRMFAGWSLAWDIRQLLALLEELSTCEVKVELTLPTPFSPEEHMVLWIKGWYWGQPPNTGPMWGYSFKVESARCSALGHTVHAALTTLCEDFQKRP